MSGGEVSVMINSILYLDSEELWDCDEKRLRIQQALEQKSWELRKLYNLPEVGTEGEIPVFSVFEEKLLVGSQEEVWIETIKNISIQIGNNKEWRLLLFLASEREPFGSEYHWLQMFLAQMMYYDNNQEINELSGLTCELPEQIWIITLRDTSIDNITPVGLQHYDSTVHEDEQIYAAYPPNCRFLCYGLDYRKENYFDREMLKMHCAIRCLARPLLPADLLKGNQKYLLGAEWDEGKFCIEIKEYEDWLQRVKRKIVNIRQNTAEARIDESIIMKPSVPITESKFIKVDGQTPVEMKRKTESLIENANIEQRRVFERYREALDECLKKQEGYILLKTKESSLREDMYEKEKNMYKKTTRTPTNWNFSYIIMRSIFRIKNWLVFKDKNSREERRLDLEKEINYYGNQIQVMKRQAISRILETLVYINLCFLITCLAGFDLGENSKVSIFGIFVGMFLTSVCGIIVFLAFLRGYQFWHKRLCKVFSAIQREKIISNKNYFRHMLDYFRLKRILNFHAEQKKKKSMQEKMYEQWEQEWEKYHEICSQFQISFGIMEHMAENLETERGNIWEMLLKKQYKELYSLHGRPAEIIVNGSSIVVPFVFIKEIRLAKIYHIS